MAKTPTMADIVDLANAVAQQGKAANQINQFAGQAAVQIAPQAKQKAVAPLVKEKIQQLPDEVKKYHQSIDAWQKENLQRLKDSTELSDDEKTQAEAALWQETQKYKQEAVKKRIAYNEDRSQNPNINQLDVAKSNLALRKQGGWKAQTDEQKRYEANIEDSDMLGLGSMGVLSGVEKFGKSALTVIPGLMDLTSQRQYENEIAARNRVAPQQNNIDDIARLMAENEASKAQIGKIQQNNQQRKAFMDKPTAFEQLYENEVGKAVAQGAKDTKTFQSGEFTGKEVLPFLAAPGSRFLEGAGIAGRVGLGVEKGLAKLGVSSGVAKALGKIGSQVVTGAEDFASQEVLPAAIQEGSKLATGEQTGGQALGNIGKRVATAGAIGAVGAPLLETGLPYVAGKVGQGIAKAVEPLQRGNQYKQVLAERAGVQAERAARNADIEQVQAGLQELNIRKAVEDATPTFQSRLAQKTEKAAQKDIQSTIKEAEQRVSSNTAFERRKIEDNIKKTGDLKYLDSFQDAVYKTGDQNLIAKYENKKSRIITEQENLIANEAKKRQIEEQRQVQALAKEEQKQIKPYLDPVNRAGNKERLASYQSTIKDLDLTPNQKNILENAVKNRYEYLAKREQLTASYKPSPKKAQSAEQGLEPKSIDSTEGKLHEEAKNFNKAEDFSKSKVNAYHGTAKSFDKFDSNKRTIQQGEASTEGYFFTNDKSEAAIYAREAAFRQNLDTKGEIMEVHLDYKNPFYLKEGERTNRPEFLIKAKKEGYDAVIDERGNIVVFDSKQIKTKKELGDIWDKSREAQLSAPKSSQIVQDGQPIIQETKPNQITVDPTVKESLPVQTAPKVDMGIPTSNTEDLVQRSELQDGLTKERGFVQTISDNPRIEPEIKAGLKDRTYTPLANKTIVEEAGRIVGEDADEAYKTLMRKDSKLLDAQDIATSRELMSKLQKEGRYDEAIDLADKLAESGTTAGQKIQAYKLYGELDPEGSILKAQRRAEKAMNPKQAEILKKKSNEIIEEVNVLKRKANKEFFNELDGFCGFDGGAL